MNTHIPRSGWLRYQGVLRDERIAQLKKEHPTTTWRDHFARKLSYVRLHPASSQMQKHYAVLKVMVESLRDEAWEAGTRPGPNVHWPGLSSLTQEHIEVCEGAIKSIEENTPE